MTKNVLDIWRQPFVSPYTEAELAKQAAECRRRFMAGERIADIARAVGLGYSTTASRIGQDVRRARLAAMEWNGARPAVTAEEIDDCVRRFEAGEGIASLAIAFEVIPSKVRDWVGPDRLAARQAVIAEHRAAVANNATGGRLVFRLASSEARRNRFAPYGASERAEQAARCLALHRQGVGMKAIAQQLGIDMGTVGRRLKEAQRNTDQAPTAQPQ
ncbi:hypothetical protein ACQP0U_24080 [Micromonospora sp. CA-269861]|uniref:hypothetical protein n=1 Tax=Micromonospora sp. CA-269861 TaxID=3239968 RepID=UPI003D8E5D4C